MAGNDNLHRAQNAKVNEFYTRYEDIEREMNSYIEYDKHVFMDKTILLPCDDPEWSNFTRYFVANFDRLGLKRLISTSYAKSEGSKQLTIFESSSPSFDREKHATHGKLFVLDRSIDATTRVVLKDLSFTYLAGDGDFKSPEVTALRDEADIIITNPPFSLFRDFISWILEANKKMIVIGPRNAITYKGIFPLIKNNQMWLGNGFAGGNAYFKPLNVEGREYADGVFDDSTGLVKFRNCCWYTNVDHGKRRQTYQGMTMADNLKYNRALMNKLKVKYGVEEYPQYDNYDAIEVPLSNAIPTDYDGVFGVPISFLEQLNPDEFEIVKFRKGNDEKDLAVNGKCPYFRILIKRRARV